jgi:hypothetical protein
MRHSQFPGFDGPTSIAGRTHSIGDRANGYKSYEGFVML